MNKDTLKQNLPTPLFNLIQLFYYGFKSWRYRTFGRPVTNLETAKAKARRTREGFFEKYCIGKGLDIGYGGDLLTADCQGWDFEHGDAQFLKGIEDHSFDFVYSGHTLEHMVDAGIALQNWWRVVKPGGYLIIYFPHRDLYEKKMTLPSNFNPDHKAFFLLDRDEPPHTLGILPLIEKSLSGYEIQYAKVCDENYVRTPDHQQSTGEYSIEVVLKKHHKGTFVQSSNFSLS